MDTACNPKYIIIDVSEIHKKFLIDTTGILGNDDDIKELFNQAVDSILDNIVFDTTPATIIFQMLRQNEMTLANSELLSKIYYEMSVVLKDKITSLNIPLTLDSCMKNLIFPYYFYNIINGKLILKSFN